MHNIEPIMLLLFCGLVFTLAITFPIAFLRRAGQQKRFVHPNGPVPPSPSSSCLPYVRKQYLLTRAERAFFDVLQTAVPPGWHVFPQVRLANLVLIERGTRGRQSHFNRIQAKCVDFVLCDAQSLSPQLVIELDDSSHDKPDRQERDTFVDAVLASAGLPILHVRWQPIYQVQDLTERIHLQLQLSRHHNSTQSVPHPALPTSTPSTHVVRWACRQCKAEVSSSAKFCNQCGAVL